MRFLSRSVPTVLVALLPAAASAQLPPFGGEFQINTTATGSQLNPELAPTGKGGFVVVWQSTGVSPGIFGQRFDGSGAKVGSEFLVNTSSGSPADPSVAADASGNFVVVWTSQDGSYTGIFGQRFDASGAKIGGEFAVNTYTTQLQFQPSVAGDGDGNFLVVWTSGANFNAQDGSGNGVFGQAFNNAGAKVGPELAVNTFTTGGQAGPFVASLGAGNFVVVWESDGQDGSEYGIFGQRFDGSGKKIGQEFPVNTYTTSDQALPSVGADSAGNFVVVWGSRDQDGSSYGFFGQRFDSAASKVGSEFSVNTFTSGFQRDGSVAMDRGAFVVCWTSANEDGSSYGVFGQRFDRSGARIGAEFQINAYTTGAQLDPRVAEDGLGLIVVWSGTAQTDSGGIFGRRERLQPLSLSVDAHASDGTTSNANGVLESGETVRLEPEWANTAAGTLASLNGGLSSFAGPPGALYLLPDAAAAYGSVPAGFFTTCDDGTPAACYRATVSAAARPAAHWDATVEESFSVGGGKTWTLHVGDSFSDVARTEPFYAKIETVFHHGIAAGCGGTKYCPGAEVSRDQMAIFLARGLAGSGELVPASGSLFGSAYDCRPGGTSLFLDVTPTDSFCKHVHYIASRNVTLGCGVTEYCPGETVTRDAMASFIAKAMVAPGGGGAVPASFSGPAGSYSCDPGSPNIHFTDVPVSSPFCKHVHFLWAKGVVGGCSATAYCPTGPVTRDAMAKFLANAFGLALYPP